MRLTRHVTRRLREVRRGSPTFHPYLVEQTFTVSGSALGHQPFVPGHFGAAVVDVQVGGVRVDPDLPADLSGERVVGTRTLTGPDDRWAGRGGGPGTHPGRARAPARAVVAGEPADGLAVPSPPARRPDRLRERRAAGRRAIPRTRPDHP